MRPNWSRNQNGKRRGKTNGKRTATKRKSWISKSIDSNNSRNENDENYSDAPPKKKQRMTKK